MSKAHLALSILAAGALLLHSPLARAQAPAFLSQNWSDAQRQAVYSTTQGSRMMRYDWFKALEQATSEELFLADGLARYGYLPNPQGVDGLPVGFVKDPKWSRRDNDYIGLNCAACHTNQIRRGDKLLQIDGGPTMADLYGLLEGIGAALRATAYDDAKFTRFGRRVLGPGNDSSNSLRRLRTELRDFTVSWESLVRNSTTPVPWGRARADAFGMIFNRVTAIDTGIESNNAPPNAPVSYPFLWGTSFEDVVQWNGSAPNTNDITRLARNVGEVLGVFAHADLTRKATPLRPFYATSAQRLNQIWIEEQLKTLWSPKWPEEILGAIDPVKKEAGRQLFAQHCVQCHVVVPHGEQHTPVKVTMTPISELKTDPKMAENAARRTVSSGPLEGARFALFEQGLPARLPSFQLTGHAVVGAILELRFEPLGVEQALRDAPSALERAWGSASAFRLESLAKNIEIMDKLKEVTDKIRAMTPANESEDVLKYKGRPLDGIWATAPYLHNGSVVSLYEILLPPHDRTPVFHVGNIEFDPVGVGFVTGAAPNSTPFDTSKEGNSNAGHDYGSAVLTPEQRWELVEYMKSL